MTIQTTPVTFPLRAEMPTDRDVPGSYNFTCAANDIVGDEQTSGMHFSCPCGCGNISYLAFTYHPDAVRGGGPEWEWDGNRERPTLKSSVLQSGLPCKWHGWLRDGYWVLA
jgi:hypothetical protein